MSITSLDVLADRDRAARVGTCVYRRSAPFPAALLAVAGLCLGLGLGLGLGACGGKQKTKGTAQSSGTVSNEDATPMEDGSADTTPDTDDPDGDGAAGKDGKTPGKDATAGGTTPDKKEPPKIEPPNLDLPATDQRKRIQVHLVNARSALTGERKDPDRALNEARTALQVDATSIDAVVLMAHAYHAKSLDDTAEVVLDMMYREREEAKSNPGVYYVYGLIYDQTNRPERAMLAYQKAGELDPNHKSALINLGVHYLRNRMFADAVKAYERLTGELGVNTAVVWTNLGSAYRGHSADFGPESPRRGELLRQAETTYKRAISVDRNYANAYYNLGLLYLDAEPFPEPDGRPMDTIKRLERAKTYFAEYRSMSGADLDLVDERSKQVEKLIKREEKRRKRDAESGGKQ